MIFGQVGRWHATVAIAIAMAVCGVQARAADPIPAPVVGVVDLQTIMAQSTAGQSVIKQREDLRNALKADVAKQEKELHEADQELARQRSILAPEAFQERQRALGMRVAEVQRSVEYRKIAIERAVGTAFDEIQKKTIEATGQVASERGVNLVLLRPQVVMFDGKFELDPAVLEKVNKALTKLAVPDPAKFMPSKSPAPAKPAAGGK